MNTTLTHRDRLTDDQVEALNDEAERANAAADLEAMRFTLNAVFRNAIARSGAPSTPLVPTTFRLNVAQPGQPDRFEYRLLMQPVTVLGGEMQDSMWFVDLLFRTLRTDDTRDLIAEMAETYADAHAAGLVAIAWSAQ